jgi:hypothetical protein
MRRQARRLRRRFALPSRIAWGLAAFLTQAFGQGSSAPAAGDMVNYRVDGDAILEPLIAAPGDAVRGRAIVADRSLGLCLLCHTAPIAEARSQGDIAPDLSGAASRLSEEQLRLRLVDAPPQPGEHHAVLLWRWQSGSRGFAMARQGVAECAADRRRGRLPAHAAQVCALMGRSVDETVA